MKLRVDRLEKIIQKIEEEPRRLNMDGWGGVVAEQEVKADDTMPPCGTVGCIAGWALMLRNRGALQKKLKLVASLKPGVAITSVLDGGVDVFDTAAKYLGLTDAQASALFYTSRWPQEYRLVYDTAHSQEQRMQATVARIRYMMDTGE